MRGRTIPRGLVLALAAFIVAGSAALAFAANYRTNGQGLVIHHHTNNYTVYNGVGSGDTQLGTKIEAARQAWKDGPTSNGLVARETIGLSSTSIQASSHIDFERSNEGQNNAKVIWSEAYHDSHTVARFNSYYSNNMSGAEKQGRACVVIGNILGIDSSAGATDCMSDPTTYTTPGANVLGLVDDFYGPNMPSDNISGSLIANKDHLEMGQPYNLDAAAVGHAMARVDIWKDTAPSAIATSSTVSPCSDGEKCSRTASITGQTPAQLGLAPGAHSLHIVAKNEFGLNGGTDPADVVTADRNVTVVDTEAPDLGVSGSLVTQPGNWLDPAPYSITATASDLGTGVQDITLSIDDEIVDEETQSCTTQACPLELTSGVDLADYAFGSHDVVVAATDGASNTETSSTMIKINAAGQLSPGDGAEVFKATDPGAAVDTAGSDDPSILSAVLADSASGFTVETGDIGGAEVAGDPSAGFSVPVARSDEAADPDPSLPTAISAAPADLDSNATELTREGPGWAITANAQPDTDMIYAGIPGGLDTYLQVRGADAPQEFSWQVDLPQDEELVAVDGVEAQVKDPDGTAIYSIGTEDGVDGEGQWFSVSLSVVGNDVILTLPEHDQDLTYPLEVPVTFGPISADSDDPTASEKHPGTAGCKAHSPRPDRVPWQRSGSPYHAIWYEGWNQCQHATYNKVTVTLQQKKYAIVLPYWDTIEGLQNTGGRKDHVGGGNWWHCHSLDVKSWRTQATGNAEFPDWFGGGNLITTNHISNPVDLHCDD